MAALHISKICAFAVLISIPLAHTAQSTPEATIEATPSSFYEGLTKSLTVNCSHNIPDDSTVTSTMSIILSKTFPNHPYIYQEVAAVTTFAPDHVDVKGALNAEVTGHIATNGQGYITVKFTNPNEDAAGQYKCQVNGMDAGGHPQISSDVVDVKLAQSVTLDILLAKIRELDANQIKLQEKVDDLEEFKSNVTHRLNDTKSAMFEANATHNGHTYFLSKPMVTNIAISDSLCRTFGGYLAEINDDAEYTFIRKFTITDHGATMVVLGATDVIQDHKWRYIYSDTPVTWERWADGQTGGTGANCMNMWQAYSPGVVDEPCVSFAIKQFLCEMP